MHLVNALNLVMVHLQFTNTIEANILLATGQVANATITRVETGSIEVWNKLGGMILALRFNCMRE